MEDTHMSLWKTETWVSAHEKAWLRWIDELESVVGHNLDGTQWIDGYSLDHSYKMWEDGLNPQAAAEVIKHNKAIVAMIKEA